VKLEILSFLYDNTAAISRGVLHPDLRARPSRCSIVLPQVNPYKPPSQQLKLMFLKGIMSHDLHPMRLSLLIDELPKMIEANDELKAEDTVEFMVEKQELIHIPIQVACF
jgi:hypothetical protein